MVEALTRAVYRLSLLVALLAVPSTVFAHRDDEYLQATLVAIEPSGIRLQINLTPGIAVAERVIARSIVTATTLFPRMRRRLTSSR
ncbi:MAG TPA: hypothetical protein VGH22_08860 [Candidatus Binatia bacterium]|jgi:hypothetical protein